MIVAELTPTALADRLAGPGLPVRMGPFWVRVRTRLTPAVAGLRTLYGRHETAPDRELVDFEVELRPGRGVRRFLRPQARFLAEGEEPFQPQPFERAPLLLEWGINWCIANFAGRYLMIHAAAVARGDAALLLPAHSGAGKSTLAATLAHRGWRLLTDEITLIDPDDGTIRPLCRPISLKDGAVRALRRVVPGLEQGLGFTATSKGDIHLIPPSHDSLAALDRPARMRWLVHPLFVPGLAARLTSSPRARSMLALSRHAFNYELHGRRGFLLLCDLVQAADCFTLSFGDLDAAAAAVERMADG